MVGARIRSKREAAGMTQAELAAKLYLSQPTLALIELERKAPTVRTVKEAAELFDCTTDELIFGEGRDGT